MEIFNIHLFEFLLIAGLALIVFGPERLPEVGRFIGKQVARFLAWQQQSPELKMINDVRAEFEQEIANLRDELVRTRKQLDLSQDVNQLRDELRPMLSLRDQPAAAAPAQAPPAESPQPSSAPDSEEAPVAGPPEAASPDGGPAVAAGEDGSVEHLFDRIDAASDADPASSTAPEGAARPNRLAATEPTSVFDSSDQRASQREARRRSLHDPAAYDDPPAAPPQADEPLPAANGQRPAQPQGAAAGGGELQVSAEELQLLVRRLESLSADLHALISGLQAQGVIGADWRPDAALAEQESLSR